MTESDEVKCECPAGYKGVLCEEQDHCFPNPCLNAGVCYENADSYTCQCGNGFRGAHCTERDPCRPSPCHHDATCIPEGEDFRCQCSLGWAGNTCEEEDRCHPNPCSHGGVCIAHGGNSYECHCPSGFNGINCEVDSVPVEHHLFDEHSDSAPSCRNTRYGCCPDGENAANGVNGAGCPELRHDNWSERHVAHAWR